MERLLAMSILSSTPTEIYGSWTMKKDSDNRSSSSKSTSNDNNWRKGENKAGEDDTKRRKPQRWQSRFAPEFDGICCFETVVSL